MLSFLESCWGEDAGNFYSFQMFPIVWCLSGSDVELGFAHGECLQRVVKAFCCMSSIIQGMN
jgi:hypothetical protein